MDIIVMNWFVMGSVLDQAANFTKPESFDNTRTVTNQKESFFFSFFHRQVQSGCMDDTEAVWWTFDLKYMDNSEVVSDYLDESIRLSG
ncbi:hypothetical protein C1645_840874 [Glomus cerebriforme]|uniref:Uncharacterized protein n=1 Tax=Glomus cerebriforme TaxID=658196 RepID=A0A397S096_9GLOM|nr:hypothetical protein C1645_840874 [Glomus cerebriforme]